MHISISINNNYYYYYGETKIRNWTRKKKLQIIKLCFCEKHVDSFYITGKFCLFCFDIIHFFSVDSFNNSNNNTSNVVFKPNHISYLIWYDMIYVIWQTFVEIVVIKKNAKYDTNFMDFSFAFSGERGKNTRKKNPLKQPKHGPCLSQKKLNSFPIFWGCLSFCSHIRHHVCWPHPKIIHHPTNIVVLLKETKKKNHFFVSGTTKRNDQNEIYMCFIGQLILCVCVCCPNWLCCCCCHSFFWLFQIGHHHHYHQKKKNVWKKRRITIWWLASINLRIKILMIMMMVIISQRLIINFKTIKGQQKQNKTTNHQFSRFSPESNANKYKHKTKAKAKRKNTKRIEKSFFCLESKW